MSYLLDVTFYVKIATADDLSGYAQSRMQCDQVTIGFLWIFFLCVEIFVGFV